MNNKNGSIWDNWDKTLDSVHERLKLRMGHQKKVESAPVWKNWDDTLNSLKQHLNDPDLRKEVDFDDDIRQQPEPVVKEDDPNWDKFEKSISAFKKRVDKGTLQIKLDSIRDEEISKFKEEIVSGLNKMNPSTDEDVKKIRIEIANQMDEVLLCRKDISSLREDLASSIKVKVENEASEQSDLRGEFSHRLDGFRETVSQLLEKIKQLDDKLDIKDKEYQSAIMQHDMEWHQREKRLLAEKERIESKNAQIEALEKEREEYNKELDRYNRERQQLEEENKEELMKLQENVMQRLETFNDILKQKEEEVSRNKALQEQMFKQSLDEERHKYDAALRNKETEHKELLGRLDDIYSKVEEEREKNLELLAKHNDVLKEKELEQEKISDKLEEIRLQVEQERKKSSELRDEHNVELKEKEKEQKELSDRLNHIHLQIEQERKKQAEIEDERRRKQSELEAEHRRKQSELEEERSDSINELKTKQDAFDNERSVWEEKLQDNQKLIEGMRHEIEKIRNDYKESYVERMRKDDLVDESTDKLIEESERIEAKLGMFLNICRYFANVEPSKQVKK